MKNKEQQFEEYKANGGALDFYGWEASFKYDPSQEFTREELRDWMINNENDDGCYPTAEEWKKIEAEFPAPKKNENYEVYKRDKREVLSSTILSLLADMPKERIEQLLEDGTPEELVDFCKKIYDDEFDLNVNGLGAVGADEIAWQEALGIFADTSD